MFSIASLTTAFLSFCSHLKTASAACFALPQDVENIMAPRSFASVYPVTLFTLGSASDQTLTSVSDATIFLGAKISAAFNLLTTYGWNILGPPLLSLAYDSPTPISSIDYLPVIEGQLLRCIFFLRIYISSLRVAICFDNLSCSFAFLASCLRFYSTRSAFTQASSSFRFLFLLCRFDFSVSSTITARLPLSLNIALDSN